MRIFNITIEINDDISLEEMEEIVDDILVNNGINCTYEVAQMED